MINSTNKNKKSDYNQKKVDVTYEEAEKAIEVLLRWIGENPHREGLVETPKRVISSFSEFFYGYNVDPESILEKTFSETSEYEGMILLKNIVIESHCEHHMAPILGKAHIAYVPKLKVVGISKLARVAEAYAKRLQIQERLTAEIAHCIYKKLQPQGVAVVISAKHYCMAKRGIRHKPSSMLTNVMLGSFKEDEVLRREFWNAISS